MEIGEHNKDFGDLNHHMEIWRNQYYGELWAIISTWRLAIIRFWQYHITHATFFEQQTYKLLVRFLQVLSILGVR